jgi:hypothetical protein
LALLHKAEWVVYAKRAFGGHEAVLVAPSRYTHRVAISNSPLIALNDAGVSFKWKDYRAKGREKAKEMTLNAKLQPGVVSSLGGFPTPPSAQTQLTRRASETST